MKNEYIESKEVKRRDWVKNAIIVFLLIILLLTFFSNTITNYSLPQVSTAQIVRGSITESVRGTGNVEAGDPYTMNADETRKIDSVVVSKGDHVEIGDTIFVMADIESDELKKAEEDLKKLEDTYYADMFATGASADNIAKARSGNYDSLATMQSKLAQLDKDLEDAIVYQNDCQNEVYVQEILVAIEKNDIDINSLGVKEAKALVDAEISKMNNQKEYNAAMKLETDADLEKALKEAKNRQADLLASTSITSDATTIEKETASLALNNANQILAAAKAHTLDVETKRKELLDEMSAEIKLESTAESIVDKQAEIERLQSKAIGAVITAPVAGTVQTINYVAGEKMETGKPICVIIPDGKDMIVKFSVKSELAKKVSVGAQAEFDNAWYYQDAISFLKNISDDTENPGKSVLTFTVEGTNIKVGQSLTLTVGSSTKDYSMTIPKAALKKDNSGSFVYVLVEKSSPLGNRYIAEKRTVTVEAEGDNTVAIAGSVYEGDYVITISNKMVESGKQVRLSESSAN